MPKETIYGDLLPFAEESPARSVIELGWSKEAEHVQLATRCIHAADHSTYIPSDVEAVIERAQPAAEREAEMRAVLEGTPGPPRPEPDLRGLTCFEGMYVQLNRRSINDLIRHLRRARDQAFGRDE